MGKLKDIQGHLQPDQGCTYAEIKCQNFGFRLKITQSRKHAVAAAVVAAAVVAAAVVAAAADTNKCRY